MARLCGEVGFAFGEVRTTSGQLAKSSACSRPALHAGIGWVIDPSDVRAPGGRVVVRGVVERLDHHDADHAIAISPGRQASSSTANEEQADVQAGMDSAPGSDHHVRRSWSRWRSGALGGIDVEALHRRWRTTTRALHRLRGAAGSSSTSGCHAVQGELGTLDIFSSMLVDLVQPPRSRSPARRAAAYWRHQ